MSRPIHKLRPSDRRARGELFAALGDPTRLALLDRLSAGSNASISRLTGGMPVSRQAITKHLRVLQRAGLVRGVRSGRENLFQLERNRLEDAQRFLENISRQWDVALARLKSFVEE
jgi:DNA-binding transcriptional ArsR family regulator